MQNGGVSPVVLSVMPELCRHDRPRTPQVIWGRDHYFRWTLIVRWLPHLCGLTLVEAVQEKPTMQTIMPKPTRSGYAAVNGIRYYYAVYGTGEPLLLLHGGLGQIEMFGPNLARLAQRRQVIGVDLQGHGRTGLGDREISLIDMGDDMAGVLKQLGYDKVDVLGYSMGGGVAFQFAVRHPEMVRRMVLASCPFAQDGFYRRDVAAAGGSRLRDGRADERNADVQVVRGDCTAPGGVSRAA